MHAQMRDGWFDCHSIQPRSFAIRVDEDAATIVARPFVPSPSAAATGDGRWPPPCSSGTGPAPGSPRSPGLRRTSQQALAEPTPVGAKRSCESEPYFAGSPTAHRPIRRSSSAGGRPVDRGDPFEALNLPTQRAGRARPSRPAERQRPPHRRGLHLARRPIPQSMRPRPRQLGSTAP
jgi:hypothetical protein